MGEHFAALGPAGVEIRLRDPLVQSFELGGGISVVTTLPESILAVAGEIPPLPLWLVATRHGNLDQYDQYAWESSVRNDLALALKAILLVVPFSCPWFVFLSSGNSKLSRNERVEQGYLHTAGLPKSPNAGGGLRVGLSELRKASEVLSGLQVIFRSGSVIRIRRGLRAFFHGLQEELTEDRLHQFVRSLEAVINPKRGNITSQFVHRLQVFTGSGPDVADVLKECYEIRSKVEHLQSTSAVLPHVPPPRRNVYIYLHTRRIEALCRHVYERITSSPKHLAMFKDATIDKFWDKSQVDQRATWGEPLNSFTGTPWGRGMKRSENGA